MFNLHLFFCVYGLFYSQEIKVSITNVEASSAGQSTELKHASWITPLFNWLSLQGGENRQNASVGMVCFLMQE